MELKKSEIKNVLIPPLTTCQILLDHGVLTNAHPQLTINGGKGAHIEMVYAESLVSSATGIDDKDPAFRKGQRNDIVGKSMEGKEI